VGETVGNSLLLSTFCAACARLADIGIDAELKNFIRRQHGRKYLQLSRLSPYVMPVAMSSIFDALTLLLKLESECKTIPSAPMDTDEVQPSRALFHQ